MLPRPIYLSNSKHPYQLYFLALWRHIGLEIAKWGVALSFSFMQEKKGQPEYCIFQEDMQTNALSISYLLNVLFTLKLNKYYLQTKMWTQPFAYFIMNSLLLNVNQGRKYGMLDIMIQQDGCLHSKAFKQLLFKLCCIIFDVSITWNCFPCIYDMHI